MTLVAFEGSSRPGSVAVLTRDEVVVERALAQGAAHASDLLPTLDALLAELTPDASRPASEIDGVLVGTGPGSFTGLRVAIATAMGIARGLDVPMRGVGSFEALAFDVLAEDEEACFLVDARARELYFAHFRRTADDVVAVVEPQVVPLNDVPTPPSGARVFADAKAADAAGIAPERVEGEVRPGAGAVLRLGRERLARLGAEPPERVAPLYLRPFAAIARAR